LIVAAVRCTLADMGTPPDGIRGLDVSPAVAGPYAAQSSYGIEVAKLSELWVLEPEAVVGL
jgi:hypothetical protein